ncbi:MAG TPA: VOC family protein [Patescibacteria group bacterium]|nr:VOC family protein [Patescibacteria group bacterium]
MLGDSDVAATIPTKDIGKAAKFYEETLGLKKGKDETGGIVFKSGNSTLFLYETQFAGTNKATSAGWVTDDVEGVAKDLKSKGVKLEQYHLPGVKREGDIHIMGDLKAIWFKDPDGNILSVSTSMA